MIEIINTFLARQVRGTSIAGNEPESIQTHLEDGKRKGLPASIRSRLGTKSRAKSNRGPEGVVNHPRWRREWSTEASLRPRPEQPHPGNTLNPGDGNKEAETPRMHKAHLAESGNREPIDMDDSAFPPPRNRTKKDTNARQRHGSKRKK
ncbi:hypothetical protein Nepgr_007944 [Nepenthes gracilis]|uniref:Uncharacterized protein n=1 Tax=Nepenthes gracilis TaxID=150966 RepID=A0AAD3XIT5_NEPGR|nr:hypothetical protein Nepgr_007944 [Nepenthes gracilis]